MLIQLEFWKSPQECFEEQIIERVDKSELSLGKMRRKLFAENGALKQQVLELSDRVAIMERNICRGK